jgi:RNA polymerase sigma factor (sigma-70 family)
MFDDMYYLAIVRDGNRQRFCVGVPQFNGKSRLIETNEVIYWLLKSFQREDWRQERQARRHLERIVLSDEELSDRCGAYAPSPEDMLYRRILSDGLQRAFLKLPPVQARRFLLHHGLELTYREIGEAEGCTDRAVKHSVFLAKKKLQRILR